MNSGANRDGCLPWLGCPFTAATPVRRPQESNRALTPWSFRVMQSSKAVNGLYETHDATGNSMFVLCAADVPVIDSMEKNVQKRLESYTYSLTGSEGDTWKRQRQAITQKILPAFYAQFSATDLAKSIYQQSIEERWLLARMHPRNASSKWACLSSFLRKLVGSWITELMLGPYPPPNFLCSTFIPYYQEFRSRYPMAERRAGLHAKLIESLDVVVQTALHSPKGSQDVPSTAFRCILEPMIACEDLHRQEIPSNLESFLIAGFETTYTIILATIMMIASEPERRIQRAIRESLAPPGSAMEADEYKQVFVAIRELKSKAQVGESLSTFPTIALDPEQNLLLRCLVETLRMFPPVWGLPRQNKSGQKVKVDVVCCHSVRSNWPHEWNPLQSLVGDSGKLASFGLGHRGCPAGGTALCVAYVLVKSILFDYDLLAADRASFIASAYLSPTLSFQGEQYVQVCQVAR